MSLEMMVDTDGVEPVVQGSTAPDGGIGQILAYGVPDEQGHRRIVCRLGRSPMSDTSL